MGFRLGKGRHPQPGPVPALSPLLTAREKERGRMVEMTNFSNTETARRLVRLVLIVLITG